MLCVASVTALTLSIIAALSRSSSRHVRSRLTECHALVGQLPLRVLVLGQVRQTHAAEDVGGFGELDIVVANDLNAVAPRVAEVTEWAFERRKTINARRFICRSSCQAIRGVER